MFSNNIVFPVNVDAAAELISRNFNRHIGAMLELHGLKTQFELAEESWKLAGYARNLARNACYQSYIDGYYNAGYTSIEQNVAHKIMNYEFKETEEGERVCLWSILTASKVDTYTFECSMRDFLNASTAPIFTLGVIAGKKAEDN